MGSQHLELLSNSSPLSESVTPLPAFSPSLGTQSEALSDGFLPINSLQESVLGTKFFREKSSELETAYFFSYKCLLYLSNC